MNLKLKFSTFCIKFSFYNNSHEYSYACIEKTTLMCEVYEKFMLLQFAHFVVVYKK